MHTRTHTRTVLLFWSSRSTHCVSFIYMNFTAQKQPKAQTELHLTASTVWYCWTCFIIISEIATFFSFHGNNQTHKCFLGLYTEAVKYKCKHITCGAPDMAGCCHYRTKKLVANKGQNKNAVTSVQWFIFPFFPPRDTKKEEKCIRSIMNDKTTVHHWAET